LDPRYPEVREFIIQTYEKALTDWNLDGFKLDFIGRFSSDDKTILTKENGRDFASVNEATDHLMTEIMRRLVKIRPEIMIEFRQPYIGPLMRKYGNMFRGVDCPNNAVANRIETTNLKIMAGNTAVHSDMFIWRKEEPVEAAALQILNILYSVPQLSVRLEEIPERHLNMIKNWFSYWNTNRGILLDGEFIPGNPTANYPILTAFDDSKQITTLFENLVVKIENDKIKNFDIINAKASTSVLLKLKTTLNNCKLTIYDCEGNEVFGKTADVLKAGINELQIPQSGRIEISWGG
jgi:alpha-galactosidase